MNDFLPKGYEIPNKTSGYMKFEQGANKFRILSSAITGYEFWADVNGKRTPLRFRMDQKFSESDLKGAKPEEGKHFWAFVVWNYGAEMVQILEVTQKSIQKAIKAMVASEDWGDPKKYDIIVTKEGEKLDTDYQTSPVPPKELPDFIQALYRDTYINLNALYEGKDPFNEDVKPEEVKI